MPSKNVRTGSTRPVARKPAAAASPVAPEPKIAATKPAVTKPAVTKPAAAEPVKPAVPFVTPPKAVAPAKPVERVAEVVQTQTAPVAPEIIEKPATAIAAMATVTKAVEKETQTMQNTVENTVNQTQAGAQALFGDMNDRTKGAMEKSAKMVEEMNDFAKGNLEAVVESSRIAAKGMESIGQEAAEFTRKSFEQATATMKNMASVKSPTELFKLQSDFMRSAFDMYVAEASKTTEHMMKLAGDAAQPLSNRMAVAADKVKVAA